MSDNQTLYVDIANMEEDSRIDTIGQTVMKHRKTVAFMTDSDPGKAERYIAKLKAKFPGIRIVDFFNGPVPGAVTVKVAPADSTLN